MRIAVLASGSGTNLQALIDAARDSRLGTGEIVLVASDRPTAPALDRARAAGIATIALPADPGEPREAYDVRLRDAVAEHHPDLVVLAGTPLACDDGLACTLDGCDDSTGQCTHGSRNCDDGLACTSERCDEAEVGLETG